MLGEMTPREFAEWRAFEQLEPFGTKQLAHMLGQLLRSQHSSEIEDSDLAALMGYIEPLEAVDSVSSAEAVKRGFGVV